jgi:hypothetical protein
LHQPSNSSSAAVREAAWGYTRSVPRVALGMAASDIAPAPPCTTQTIRGAAPSCACAGACEKDEAIVARIRLSRGAGRCGFVRCVQHWQSCCTRRERPRASMHSCATSVTSRHGATGRAGCVRPSGKLDECART